MQDITLNMVLDRTMSSFGSDGSIRGNDFAIQVLKSKKRIIDSQNVPIAHALYSVENLLRKGKKYALNMIMCQSLQTEMPDRILDILTREKSQNGMQEVRQAISRAYTRLQREYKKTYNAKFSKVAIYSQYDLFCLLLQYESICAMQGDLPLRSGTNPKSPSSIADSKNITQRHNMDQNTIALKDICENSREEQFALALIEAKQKLINDRCLDVLRQLTRCEKSLQICKTCAVDLLVHNMMQGQIKDAYFDKITDVNASSSFIRSISILEKNYKIFVAAYESKYHQPLQYNGYLSKYGLFQEMLWYESMSALRFGLPVTHENVKETGIEPTGTASLIDLDAFSEK